MALRRAFVTALGAVAVFAAVVCPVHSTVLNFQDLGGAPGDDSLGTCIHNTAVMNNTLAKLQPGDTLLVPNTTFWMMGGVSNGNHPLVDVTFQLDGTLKFIGQPLVWPRQPDGRVLECIYLQGVHNSTFTSSGIGTLDGNGAVWWGYISYLLNQENRPRLFHMDDATNNLFENILLRQSPYWTFLASDVNGLEIRDSHIDNRRDDADYHTLWDMGAFNTDGFDVSGANVHIHDCTIWNDDDCVCAKPIDSTGKNAQCTENWMVERVQASGVGLTIGSVGPSPHHNCVRNITFRDSYMHNTYKGLYVKSDPGSPGETAEITNILYSNITIFNATQWSIWIGPQQASYGGCCNLLWPWIPGLKCPAPIETVFTNITLRDVKVVQPQTSPGVILGNSTSPMTGIVFDHVVVEGGGTQPWGKDGYKCEGVKGIATGGTSPVPPCFATVDNE